MKAFLLFLFTFITYAAMGQETSSPILIGKTDVQKLTDAKAYPWFNAGYQSYTPDTNTIADLKKILPGDATFLVFGGTWCSDTQHLLPQFYKALEEGGISRKLVELYMLDEKKTSPDGTEKRFGVNNVPTFILQVNGEERGRIVETVTQTIEADLIKLLKNR